MPIEAVADLPAVDDGDALARPYFEMEDGVAKVRLIGSVNGVNVLTVRRLKAREFADARSASNGDDDQFYMRAIGTATGLPTPTVADLDAQDYILLRKVLDGFLGF